MSWRGKSSGITRNTLPILQILHLHLNFFLCWGIATRAGRMQDKAVRTRTWQEQRTSQQSLCNLHHSASSHAFGIRLAKFVEDNNKECRMVEITHLHNI